MKRSIILQVVSSLLMCRCVCWIYEGDMCKCIHMIVVSIRETVEVKEPGQYVSRKRKQLSFLDFELHVVVRPLISGCPHTTRIFPGCEAQNPRSLRKVDSIYSPKSVPEKATTQLTQFYKKFPIQFYSPISITLLSFFYFPFQNILE